MDFRLPSLLLATVVASATASAAPRPNILFLFSDDHALNAISAYGGRLKDVAPTPNIDRLATQGALFRHSFCCNSICGPSRAAILTGKHSHINGFLDNDFCRFDGSQTTFPKLLRKAGYQTALIGKWHLVSEPQGFDHWQIVPGQGNYYSPDFIGPGGRKTYAGGYLTDTITDMALDWLKTGRDKTKPFLLMCQHKAPHRNWMPAERHYALFRDLTIPPPPTLFDSYANRSGVLRQQQMSLANDFQWRNDMKFTVPPPDAKAFPDAYANGELGRMTPAQRAAWDAAYLPENEKFLADWQAGRLDPKAVTEWKYQRYAKDYLRCVRALDEGIGRMLDWLDESGLAKNTVVIYSSDQGFYLGEHGWYDKRWIFEESLSMPFLIRWPGVVKPGSRPEPMIQNIDYAPTFLDMAGIPVPKAMQGRSLLPLLKGEAPAWREAVYYQYTGETTHSVAPHDGIRTATHKLVWFPSTKEWNLFDLGKDPQEMESVHDDPAYADVLARMKDLYQKTRKEYRVSDSTVPAQRFQEAGWKQRHQQKLQEAAKGGHEVVFIGDSITQGWEGAGKEVWAAEFATRQALNLGFSGDRTEHVLWRLLNGEIDAVRPKAFVVMIGTNNTGHHMAPAADTVEGIKLILELLRDRSPQSKILLCSVFPRGATADDPMRARNREINDLIRPLADGQSIRFLDCDPLFLDAGGTLPKALMPDLLHPQAEGYRRWAGVLAKQLDQLGIKKARATPAPALVPAG